MSDPILTPLGRTQPPSRRPARGPWVISGLALLVAVIALLMALRGSEGYSEEDTSVLPASDVPALELPDPVVTAPTRSLFKPPKDLEGAISTALASTVTIECGEAQGTGWSIALENPTPSDEAVLPDELTKFPGRLVTNHHVINECTDDPSSVTVKSGEQLFDAYLYSWDPENDLAIVLTSAELPPLALSPQPKAGWWALSVGSPQGYAGSVSIGNVMNSSETEVIATALMNSGNSGGPLLNAAGAVMGVTTYSTVGDAGPDPWYVSMAVADLCSSLVDCSPSALGWSAASE